jgi:oligopeptidase A
MMNVTEKTFVASDSEIRVLKLPIWSTFSVDGAIQELDALLDEGRMLKSEVASMEHPTFRDLIGRFEDLFERLSLLSGPIDYMNSMENKTYPGLLELNDEVKVKLSEFYTEFYLDKGLYEAYLRFKHSDAFTGLTDEEQYLIERDIRDFKLGGVDLPEEKKKELQTINREITLLETKFENNEIASTDAWHKLVTDEETLRGIPDDDKKRMREHAKEKGQEGWRITLQYPDYLAVVMYAEDRTLRKEMQDAWCTSASEVRDNGKYDNTSIARELVEKRSRAANILGHPTHAHASLVDRMAESVGVEGVRAFLEELTTLAAPKAAAEMEEMRSFAREHLGLSTVESWDFLFVEEKMSKAVNRIDQEEVRSYFPYPKVIEGLAYVLNRLYGVTIEKEPNASTWRDGVELYLVRDETETVSAAFYADMYSREGKTSGAQMNTYLASRKIGETLQVPVAYLMCNVNAPEAGSDSYLRHDDVQTLFHEAGHCFHLLLGRSKYSSSSMEKVEWDAVELPSQIMENWCWEKDLLRRMTAHKMTGAPMPEELMDRLIASRKFNAGLYANRQLCFGILDWRLYSQQGDILRDPRELWEEIARTIYARPENPSSRFTNTFGHIFCGPYSAGYYSYMWALALSADAYRVFLEVGDIFSREVGQRFLREVLARGSSRPIAESFRAFRGRELDPKALAIHLGLIEK